MVSFGNIWGGTSTSVIDSVLSDECTSSCMHLLLARDQSQLIHSSVAHRRTSLICHFEVPRRAPPELKMVWISVGTSALWLPVGTVCVALYRSPPAVAKRVPRLQEASIRKEWEKNHAGLSTHAGAVWPGPWATKVDPRRTR